VFCGGVFCFLQKEEKEGEGKQRLDLAHLFE